MARTINQISQQILDSISADPTLGPLLTSTSKRSIYGLFAFIVATAINILEQIIDVFTANVESIAASAPPATPAWLQNQIFQFQYSATNPQVVQLINFKATYPVIDPTLQIISRCSVQTTSSNQVQIKVATQDPPIALTADQQTALINYINSSTGIGIAGITYNVISLPPDELYVDASVYYNGTYSLAIIQGNVIAAINTYLSSLPFNGTIKISDLELAIRTTIGVNDVELNNVFARPDGTAFSEAIHLLEGQKVLQTTYNTISGYIIPETTGGETLMDSLNFTAQ